MEVIPPFFPCPLSSPPRCYDLFPATQSQRQPTGPTRVRDHDGPVTSRGASTAFRHTTREPGKDLTVGLRPRLRRSDKYNSLANPVNAWIRLTVFNIRPG